MGFDLDLAVLCMDAAICKRKKSCCSHFAANGGLLGQPPCLFSLVLEVVILTARESLRRCFCVLSLLVDGLLEEAVAQIDSLLRSPQPAAREVPVAQTAQPTETTHWYLLHWLLHGLCLIFGRLRRRTP